MNRTAFPLAALALAALAVIVPALAAPPPKPAQSNPTWGQARFGQHDPSRKVYFRIVFDEKAGGAEYDWAIHGEALYALLPAWDGINVWGFDAPESVGRALGGQAAATSEKLYEKRGGFLGLKQGEFLQFYVKELHYVGDGRVGDQKDKWSYDRRDDAWSEVGCGSTYRGHDTDAVDNKSATLKRTPTGATLTFRWEIAPSGSCDAGDSVYSHGMAGADAKRMLVFNLTEAELRNWSTIHKVNQGTVRLAVEEVVNVKVSATLLPAPLPPEEIEVTVEPAFGYEKWVPAGTLSNAEEPGEMLAVTAKVHKAGDPTKRREAELTFELGPVSEQKGVCMNWPRGSSAEAKKGLRLRQADQVAGAPVEVTSETVAKTKGAVDEARVVVSSFDFGAWGSLKVAGTDREGRPVKVKVKVRGEEKPFLDIPLDENGNRIADAWEREKGFGDPAASQDEETDPAGKSEVRGDGLSLYEEYRGFSVKGKHVRGNPKKKDLFVCDDTLKQMAGPGIDLFERITGLEVHRVTYEELGEDRVINPNASEAHVVDQHGILVASGSEGLSPHQVPSGPDNGLFGPPGMTLRVEVPRNMKMDAAAASTIAHELGHAIGLSHHGDNFRAVAWWWGDDGALWEQGISGDSDATGQTKVGSAIKITAFWEPSSGSGALKPFIRGDAAPPGTEWDDKLKAWKLFVVGKQSANAGDTSCVMVYQLLGAFLPFDGPPGTVRYIPDPTQNRTPTGLCSDAKGTGVNAPDHKPVPRHGDAAVGNCKGQIVVNDRYVPPKRLAD